MGCENLAAHGEIIAVASRGLGRRRGSARNDSCTPIQSSSADIATGASILFVSETMARLSTSTLGGTWNCLMRAAL